MFDFLKVLIGSLAILFIGNAVLGSDRLWVYMDYSAISEQEAMDSARTITVSMPTEMTLKGTSHVVKLKKGDKVKLLARYQKYLTPIVRSGDYLPTYDFVVMLPDSTICMGPLPEALTGATAAVTSDGRIQYLEVTKLKAAKNVIYEENGKKERSKYGFWVCLSDGSKLAFEQLTWKRIGFTRYNAHGRWELNDTMPQPQVIIDPTEMNAAGYNVGDTTEDALGSRSAGFYKVRHSFINSGRMKTWSARGVAGMVEGLLLIVVLLSLPWIVHHVVYRLPGKNWWIIFLSWVALIVMSVVVSALAVTSLFNHIFFILPFLSLFFVKSDVESSRCKYCGGVDCLQQVGGTPKKSRLWWTKWHKGQVKIGEIVETVFHDDTDRTSTTHDINRKTTEKQQYETTTWGEAYYCKKCHMRYEYHRSEKRLVKNVQVFTESEKDAIEKKRKELHIEEPFVNGEVRTTRKR